MEYIFTSTFGLAISFLLYLLFLKREKTFKFNRFFLLGSLILSMLFPALQFDLGNTFSQIPKINMEEVSSGLFHNDMSDGKTVEKLERKNDLVYPIFICIYFCISFLFLMRFSQNLFKILNYIKKKNFFEIKGLKVIQVSQNTGPHSFFNLLFINEDDFAKQTFSEAIIQHELAHSDQLHSLDVVFIELLICIFWFNPFIWLYKKAILENHEFLADAQVMKTGIAVDRYCHQLIKTGNKNFNFPLSSGFNFNQTKNRILMLYKKNSSKMVLSFKIGMVMSLFTIVFVFISCTKDSSPNSKPFVVVVDAGHGGIDSGVFNEKEITLQIAEKLAALSNENVIIVPIRENDEFVSLADRVKFTKNHNADLFLSLHCNASKDKTKSGVEAYFARNGKSKEKSQQYSKIMVSNYIEEIALQGEIKTAGFLVLRTLEIPGILLELGYLSNEKEAGQLQNEEFQQKIAGNIFKSLLEIKENQ